MLIPSNFIIESISFEKTDNLSLLVHREFNWKAIVLDLFQQVAAAIVGQSSSERERDSFFLGSDFT